MYYYLLYNSSLINNYGNQKFIVVTGIGSILYMITHAITFHTNIEFLKILRSYFWNIFMLDIVMLSYKIWGSESISPNSNENLKLSINLLKNRIYDMLDTKHTIKISDETSSISANPQSPPSQQSSNLFTPIHKIKKQSTPEIDSDLQQFGNNLNLSNPFDTDSSVAPAQSLINQQQSQDITRIPNNPLVYNPKIDIPAPNPFSPSPSVGVLPPPMIIKKGSSNDYTLPTDRNIRQPLTEPVSTNIKYGFSTTMDEDLDAILMNSENKSIASDVASVIDLEGF